MGLKNVAKWKRSKPSTGPPTTATGSSFQKTSPGLETKVRKTNVESIGKTRAGRVGQNVRKDKKVLFESHKAKLIQPKVFGSRGDKAAKTADGVPVGVAGSMLAKKDPMAINEVLKRAQKSTASMGKFDKVVRNETEIRLKRKPRLIVKQNAEAEQKYVLQKAHKLLFRLETQKKAAEQARAVREEQPVNAKMSRKVANKIVDKKTKTK